MNELLRELEAVAGLAEKATPGPWVANDGELATDLYCANGSMTVDALAEFADGISDPPNAPFVAAAVNFIRTHHAEIAEAVSDAELWRYLVRENNKGGRGAFRIVWFDEGDDGFTTTDGVSVDGKDEQAIIRIVSDAMHNSAREVGE